MMKKSSIVLLLPLMFYFLFYGVDDFINCDAYEKILKAVDKDGAVIITVVEDRYTRRFYPDVFVSNNNRLKSVELN